MLEKNLELKCCRYAKDKNYLVYKFLSPQNTGVPDRIFLKKGDIFFVEFKSKSGKLSKLQEYQIKRIREHANAYVINDFEDFKRLIDDN